MAEGVSKSEKKKMKKAKASEEGQDAAPKKDKKLKEKKAKKEAARAEATVEPVGQKRKAEASPEPAANKKAKKDKKDKKVKKAKVTAVEVPAASKPVRYASVGDVELAKSSPAIVKALYSEHPTLAAMTAAEVAAFQQERNIVVEGTEVKPMTAFEQLGFDAPLLHAVRDFQAPSPIQAQCWPIILKGWDMIGIAATGSGKTLGFGMPALRHIQEQRAKRVVMGKGPFMLCMAPTRELASQISDVLADAGSKCSVSSLCVYGGVPKHTQAAALRKGVEIVVGTPGRVCDLLQEGTLRLNEVTYLVLDEADRMLDMGFEPEIRKIVTPVRADRQTLMFSATWPQEIQRLAMEFLVKPVKVTIGSEDLAASHSVTQIVEVVEEYERNDKLLGLLQKYHKSRSNRIIIFVLYKKEAPRVETFLQRKGWKAVAIHGDLSQAGRTQAVDDFKAGRVPLLIATDVAARGLDIPDVEVVINYSFPLTVEDYVHRIGRTGRAGKSGTSYTFFVGQNDKQRAGELVNVLREAGAEVPPKLMSFGTAVKKKESKWYGAHFKDIDMNKTAKKIKFGDDSDSD